MHRHQHIRQLPRHRLDTAAYDRCVLTDSAPLPYGLSWWLDAVTEGKWDALILDDYACVLPLPRILRGGLLPTYLRPPFTQQLGPFGKLEPGNIRALLSRIPRKLQIALPLRSGLDATEIPDRFRLRQRVNLVLPLDRPYGELAARFPKKLRAYLRRCAGDELEPIEPTAFVELCRQELGSRAALTETDYRTLTRLLAAAREHGCGSTYQLREDGRVLATGFYPELDGRIINLVAASTDRGRKRRGMSRLLALLIRRAAGGPGAVFDFEGSEIPGVRRFFEKFGSYDEGYPLLEERGFGLLT